MTEQTTRNPVSEELKLIKRLLSRVRGSRGRIWSTKASSGNRRVVVSGWLDADTGSCYVFQAFVDTWDKSTFSYNILRQAYGATAEEALMNLEDDIKQEEGL